ncbi:MAG TPA: hypothetical protein VGS19_13785 [Streptosporangiaceae bacterium]|nr:hypothetical protein [Streptosporangiaceae bacterium]HEV2373232.1 hypothetical protein [Streptosporangiaceae bacterium]
MQGFERADRQFLDAAALAGHLVPENSMFAFLAGRRAEVFPDAGYADLFAPQPLGPLDQPKQALPADNRLAHTRLSNDACTVANRLNACGPG